MGLLDRMIRNVANDVLGDAVRQVERSASNAISGKVSSVIDDYTEASKVKIDAKKEEMKNKIIESAENQDLPKITGNSDENEYLQFESTDRVVYHYVDEEKQIDDYVPMRVIGSMMMPIGPNGKYEGNREVAEALSDAIFEAVQKVLDELTSSHIEPANLSSRGITISQKTKLAMEDACNRYQISPGMIVFSILLPVEEGTATGRTEGKNLPSWNCPYCGSIAHGNACEACGAPKTDR